MREITESLLDFLLSSVIIGSFERGIEETSEKTMDPRASMIMAAALIFYSIGVWSERIQGRLKWWHLVFFVLGLICDTVGTGMMLDFVGGLTFDIHGITGLIAIILMLIHALWALIVLLRKDEGMIHRFHRISIFVWLVWLIPYFSPMVFAIAEPAA